MPENDGSSSRIEKVVLIVQEGCPYCKEALKKHEKAVEHEEIMVKDASTDNTTYKFAIAMGIDHVPGAVKISVENGRVTVCKLDPLTLESKECTLMGQ